MPATSIQSTLREICGYPGDYDGTTVVTIEVAAFVVTFATDVAEALPKLE